jgi:hypothetical protein
MTVDSGMPSTERAAASRQQTILAETRHVLSGPRDVHEAWSWRRGICVQAGRKEYGCIPKLQMFEPDILIKELLVPKRPYGLTNFDSINMPDRSATAARYLYILV